MFVLCNVSNQFEITTDLSCQPLSVIVETIYS